jgi:hypothetical protein
MNKNFDPNYWTYLSGHSVSIKNLPDYEIVGALNQTVVNTKLYLEKVRHHQPMNERDDQSQIERLSQIPVLLGELRDRQSDAYANAFEMVKFLNLEMMPPKQTCICPSIDLLHFGCHCSYSKRKRK